jgi:ribosomal-protein-alanine N-acetyltransferase
VSDIRRLTVDDVTAWGALERACFSHAVENEVLMAELGREDAIVIGAFSGPVMIGFASVRVCAPEAELHRIGVAPARRAHGVGRDLLVDVCARARTAGGEVVFLEVASRNRPAVRLYEHAGFVIVGRRPDYYANPRDDALVMRRTPD